MKYITLLALLGYSMATPSFKQRLAQIQGGDDTPTSPVGGDDSPTYPVG